MNSLKTIVSKELRRVFFDRRLIFTTFILPALIIGLTYSVMGSMVGKLIDDQTEYKPEVYIVNEPSSYMDFIDKNSIDEFEVKVINKSDIEMIKKDIERGDADLIVVFPENFDQMIDEYTSSGIPNIEMIWNSGEEYSQKAYSVFNTTLRSYREMILANRIGDAKYTSVYTVNIQGQDNNLVDEKKATGKALGRLMPLMISVFLFAGAMQIGIDSIAGEKERGTMATLLVTPVKRQVLAFGKTISLGIIAIFSAISSFAGILIALPFAKSIFGGDEGLNITALQFNPEDYIKLVLIMITLTGIYVGIICLMSVIAKNMKEAGTIILPFYLIVMVAALVASFSGDSISQSTMYVPVLGSILGMKNLLIGELSWSMALSIYGINIAVTIVLSLMIAKMFSNEKIMFST